MFHGLNNDEVELNRKNMVQTVLQMLKVKDFLSYY